MIDLSCRYPKFMARTDNIVGATHPGKKNTTTMRFQRRVGIVLVLVFGAMLISPLRYALLGLIKQERFYQRRPTSSWLRILKDDDARYRQWAARTLGDVGPEPGVVPALIEALKDKDYEVHHLAATSLGMIGPAAMQAVPALREALKKSDDERREFITEALMRIDPQSAPKEDCGAEP